MRRGAHRNTVNRAQFHCDGMIAAFVHQARQKAGLTCYQPRPTKDATKDR
jgi:hypothetical protein